MDTIHHLSEQARRHHIASMDMFPRDGNDAVRWSSRFAHTKHLNQLFAEASANARLAGGLEYSDLSWSLQRLWVAASKALEHINLAPKQNEVIPSRAARLYYITIGTIWNILCSVGRTHQSDASVPGTLEPFENMLKVSGYTHIWDPADLMASIQNIESAVEAVGRPEQAQK